MAQDLPTENPPVPDREAAIKANADFVQRNFTQSTIALVFIAIGSQLYSDTSQTFLSYMINTNTGISYLLSGIMYAIYVVLSAIFYILWGAISDNLRTRFGRRIPLITTGSVATGILVYFFVFSQNLLWLFIDWGILISFVNSMTKVSGSLTADLIPLEKRGRVNMILQVVTPIGSVLIYIPSLLPLMGIPLQEAWIITVDMIIYSAIGVIAFFLVKEPPVVEPPIPIIEGIKKIVDWREFAKNKNFLWLFAGGIFLSAADNAIFLNIFNFISGIFSTINFDLTIIIIFAPIAVLIMVVGIYYLGKAIDKIGRKIITYVGFGLAPVGAFTIALGGSNLIPLLLGFALFYMFYWTGSSAMSAWQQDTLPREARGRFFGILGISGAVGSAIGGIVSGLIADQYGILWIFIAAAIFLWSSLPIFSFVPETLHRETPTEQKKMPELQ
ncbi:MAG TPA: MFS transporter [Candidatus Lokiarchaeia archaeon]|nr:MFS transporter [Candidatus Lokiarchaeia archaeon]